MPEDAKEVAEIEQQLRGRAHTAAIAALEVVPFAMLIADGDGEVLAVNGKWMELSGLGRANSLGPGWLNVLEPDTRHRLREEVQRIAQEGGGATVDHQIGTYPHKRWARWWISRHDLDGLALVAIGVADVDEDYTRQANLYHLATHDSLTGLINRSHFIECIDQALRRSQRQARHVAVVYVDLDGFKRVNDQGGHSLGDRVLFAIASRLRHAVRSADMVARIGGDEFAVLCEGLGAAEQADVVARRIAMALTESVELDGERWSVAASVGAAIDRGDPDSAEELVDRADRAMYSVKLSRRPPIEAATEEDLEAAAARVTGGRRTEDGDFVYPPRRPAAPEAVVAAAEGPFGHPGGEGPFGHPAAESRFDHPAAEAPFGRAAPSERPVGGPGASATPSAGRLGVLEPDEARRALRDLAEAAGAFTPSATPPRAAPRPAGDSEPARRRLAADVLSLRESIDSIR
ncbi:MAG TPA: diguanylate cyclase, partial [Acidimicrobiales bacterium]|nr:diguanylate cyclase [Acidimicrobiales bacterium]